VGQNCGIKITAMTPQKTFRISLAAIMISFFMLAPISSNEAIHKSKKISFNTQQQVVDEGSSKQTNNTDLTIPEANKKEKNSNRGDDHPKTRHHSEEEKHKNHLYHYHRVKVRKKTHASIICIILKIIIAISYISVLLCGYMNIGH
jgi:hypothetical protein